MKAVDRRVVCTLAAKYLSVERARVRPSARLVEDLRADGLAIVQVVLALEATFAVDIDDEEIPRLRTVEDLATCVERHREAGVVED